ncbi:radical SAM protein [Promineifilum sp.]|uniref:radical SAM protein n=1 Tax=Promineifilum sp. TaxID=2664178 RepID=UPI0035AFF7E6
MDTLIKLQEIAVHMGLEPAEEVGAVPAPPAAEAQGSRGAGVQGRTPPRSPAPLLPCGLPGHAAERRAVAKKAALGVTHAALPGGGTIPLLKTLLTSACERNCHYCPFRAGRNFRRVSFSPDEMAKTFMDMRRAGVVEGLFLSSGIIGGGVHAQDKLLDTVDILRTRHRFGGYVHLKIMPGAERDQVRRAMALADRLSINLEGANPARLARLAPKKQFVEELLTPLRWIEEIRREEPAARGWQGCWPSSTTQFVVGAVDESDLELLTTTEHLIRTAGLKRAYFSAFSPIRDTPLENQPAEDPWRQHRLYQASYLFRDYGFDLEEMPFDADGRLPLDTDPKRAWAEVNLREAPVEVNRAEREELLRVPGIGPKGAAAILMARRRARLRSVDELRQIGVRTKDIEPFVLLDGRRPEYQLRLFT